MNTKVWSALAAMTVYLTACDTLKSEYYPGTQLIVSDSDIGDESIWTFNEEVYYVHRIGSNDFVAATLNWNKEKQTYERECFPIIASLLTKDHHFLSAKGEDGLYSILRANPAADMHDGSWVIQWIDADVLKSHAEAGKIEIDADGRKYTLKGSKVEQDKYLLEGVRDGIDKPCLSSNGQ
jgi:hypothetical protein